MKRDTLYGRRAWLGIVGSLALGVGVVRWLIPFSRRSAIRWLNEGDANPGMPSDAALRVVADFTGALMGRRLETGHIELLTRRLAGSATRAPRWAAQYAGIALFANRQARELDPQAAGFADASNEVRDRIVMLAMTEPGGSRLSRVATLVSADGRARWRIRYGAAPHLRALYRRSQVPWMLRGYRGAPGAPADPLEYTRPGPTSLG